MSDVRTLVIGAGISGLAAAAELQGKDTLVLEADQEIGGYCKTIKKSGFVWDYSGHFFHFKHPEIEAWLRARMPGQRIRTVEKRSYIDYRGQRIDFPFQKNIHQLPKEELIDCLYDLYFADKEAPQRSFKEMLYARFGRSIAEKFLIPYNEKLYACDLGTLDKDAMGRFFPHADVTDIIRNMRQVNNTSYNSSFTYPEGGAIEYVNAIHSALPADTVRLNTQVQRLDVERKVAYTSQGEIRYQRLISSMPFNKLVAAAGLPHQPQDFSWNRVLVFNFGFDRKGPSDVHWMYYPAREVSFYRVGFYDNIFDTDRMSLYVELGFPRTGAIDVAAMRARVLADLAAVGLVRDHQLVAEHSVVMDPAYVHITQRSIAEHQRLSAALAAHDVHSIGRYGGWTYCSIEDNMVEARSLIRRLG
ncbi:MAG: FAD-dependent oxidoreductase [Myxococcota bacterium]